MSKQKLRETMRQLNSRVEQSERESSALYIYGMLERLDLFVAAHCIALYVDLPDELPSRDWIEQIVASGRRVVLPRIDGVSMEFYDYQESSLAEGAYGILEPQGGTPIDPSQIDLMVLPGVAFCRDGRRLGRGKGFYDRYISRDGFRATLVGVGFAHQITYDIPCEAHDRLVDILLTPAEVSQLPKLISKIVNSAWGDADRLGCGVERLISMGLSWVLLRYKMELTRTPSADEPLSIDTWISSCSRVVTSRNFIIKGADGEVVGEAMSQWCMIDLKSRRPVDLGSSEINYPQFVTQHPSTIEISGKIAPIDSSDGSVASYKHVASEFDIDFNQHVNTFKYIDMMLAMLPSTREVHRGATQIDIQFAHESYLGEELTIRHKKVEAGELFEILRPDNSSAVKALLKRD